MRFPVAVFAIVALVPAPAGAQWSMCSSAVEEIDLTRQQLYQMFDDLYLRPDATRNTLTLVSPRVLFMIGNDLQRANTSGRWQPHLGKCDPVTDRSLYEIEQLLTPNQASVSGGAMAIGGGSTGSAGSAAFGSSRAADDVVVGFADRGDFTPFHAFRWTRAGGLVDLGTLDPSNNASRTSMATATSADGSVVVGVSQVGSGATQHAFRWTAAGMVAMAPPAGAGRDSRATGISAAGDVIVGDATFADPQSFTGFRSGAFRWTAAGGFQNLGALAPGYFSIATRVSADGSTIVGQGGVEVRVGNSSTNGSRAFRWTSSGGMQAIGPLAGHTHAVATGVSDNGKVVVGISSAGPLSFNPVQRYGAGTAFIWTESASIRELRQVLIDQGFRMTGVSLVTASAISQDGQYIVGDGIGPRTPSGETRPYLVKLCDTTNQVPCTPLRPAPAVADFTFTTSSPVATSVAAGQSVTASLTVTPSGGFTQAVSFACAGLPPTTACAFAPPTVTPNGAALSTTLTITTTAPTRGSSGMITTWTGTEGDSIVLVVVLLSGVVMFARSRCRGLAVAAVAMGLLASCGGGGESNTTAPPVLTGGTAAGTYPIVVTAASGSGATSLSKTLTITLTVTR
ncbi:MAG: hypothetical protein IT361_13050 [Gemmatimonadaceae bacterium]|nr:hypothetical protein [Gemmatimonadaceae bacterium]